MIVRNWIHNRESEDIIWCLLGGSLDCPSVLYKKLWKMQRRNENKHDDDLFIHSTPFHPHVLLQLQRNKLMNPHTSSTSLRSHLKRSVLFCFSSSTSLDALLCFNIYHINVCSHSPQSETGVFIFPLGWSRDERRRSRETEEKEKNNIKMHSGSLNYTLMHLCCICDRWMNEWIKMNFYMFLFSFSISIFP